MKEQTSTSTTSYSVFWRLGLPFMLGLGAIPDAWAQDMSGEATLGPTATIYADTPNNNGGFYQSICVGNRGSENDTRRAFARFNLPDIPEGATITRVVFNLNQIRVRGRGEGPKSATLEMHRVTEDWEAGEGRDVEALAACGGGGSGVVGVNWTTAPATRNALSASAELGPEGPIDITIDTDDGGANDGLIDDVQAWVDGESNFGWRFKIVEEESKDNARLIDLLSAEIYWTVDDSPDFVINPGINDAWFNALTAGQGFFIIVFEDTGIIFLAWFTYDTVLPPEDVIALLGAAEHRWLTAQGPYDGDTAILDVFLTEGGIFDMSEPAPMTGDPIGTITIVWTDCENGVLTYDIDPPGVVGEIPITRIVPDNVALCEALGES